MITLQRVDQRNPFADYTGLRTIIGSSDNYKSVVQVIFYGILGTAVGWGTWGGGRDGWSMLLILLLPLAWGLSESRWAASMLVFGYYLAGTRGLPGGAAVFFGYGAPWWYGWACWISVCVIVTAPLTVLWTTETKSRPWRFVAAICLSVIPPIGLVGWINPISVAGTLYPGCGWAGAVLSLGVLAALVARYDGWIGGLAGIAVVANLVSCIVVPKTPEGWVGANTHFPQLSSSVGGDAGKMLAGIKRIEWVKTFVKTIPANSVQVLPETVIGEYNGMSAFSLSDADDALAARGSRLLVGAEVPQDGKYQNSLVVLGAKNNEQKKAVQGIPVPISMWKPWTKSGAVADIWGHGNVIEVNGSRAGALICYEQLLPYSIFWMMVKKPDVIVAASNVWWARETSIPAIQQQMVGVFGRLFGVPIVTAVNGL